MLLPIGLTYNEHPEKTVAVERVLNMQPEVSYGGRQPIVLRSCPGLVSFASADTNGSICRGFTATEDFVYTVIDKTLYSINSAGTVTEIGRVDGTGRAGMATSGEQVFIATGTTNYLYTIATNTLAEELTSPQGRTVAFINGRFVIEDPEATGSTAGRFYWSGVLDGATWNGLNYATAEQKPDRTNRVEAYGNTLIAFGQQSIEYWRGDADGFVPITGSTQPIGLAGRFACSQADNIVCFLASDGSVRVLSGYQAVRVSTPSIEAVLAADSATQCVAYMEEGHTVFEFSTASATLCYDHAQSQLIGKPVWFEKATGDSRHKVTECIYAFGKNLVGTNDSGVIYELSRSAYPDAREFVIPMIADDSSRRWNTLDKVELICRVGSGAIPDVQPQMMMQASRDNGYIYGEEKWRDLGTVGNYDKRVRWRRLGRFLQITLKFRITDQVDFTAIGLNADVS